MNILEQELTRFEFLQQIEEYSYIPELNVDIAKNYEKIFCVKNCYKIFQVDNELLFFISEPKFYPKGMTGEIYKVKKIKFDNSSETKQICQKVISLF